MLLLLSAALQINNLVDAYLLYHGLPHHLMQFNAAKSYLR
jgi:hypothetical protein